MLRSFFFHGKECLRVATLQLVVILTANELLDAGLPYSSTALGFRNWALLWGWGGGEGLERDSKRKVKDRRHRGRGGGYGCFAGDKGVTACPTPQKNT